MIFGTPFEVAFDGKEAVLKPYEYRMNVRLLGTPRWTYGEDLLLKFVGEKTYSMSARIGLETPSYQMDAIIVLDQSDPRLSSSFVNTFFWTYADQYRRIDEDIQLMVCRLKLDYANTEDLDDHWGQILGVRRRSGESDETYRARLNIHIRIITSSGTPSNIKTVIDRIVGITGATVVESFYPATVRLSWSGMDIPKIAQTKSALITEAMDRAVASGISWSVSYPYAEYYMDGQFMGTELITYDMDTAISGRHGYMYHMTVGLWETRLANDGGIESYLMDVVSYGPQHFDYFENCRIVQESSSYYSMQTKLIDLYAVLKELTYEQGGYKSDTMKRTYIMTTELITE